MKPTEMVLLEYENQVFLDAFHDDGLLIMARGMGIERIFHNFLKLYCDPGNLVLVLNTDSDQEEYLIEQLVQENVSPPPKAITNENSANERKSIYMSGGVLFVTSRILVVDMLTERVPIDLVTGILVYKAHKIIESCQEAFILRLFRQKNKKGFIKAFSESPGSFTAGFCQVERVMKNLFVRQLFLWPRFHASVVSYLDKHKPDVIELHVHITEHMKQCQTALLDLIDACVKELKSRNPLLNMEEISVENTLTKSFDTIVRRELNPIWHQLGPKTRQLVSDIKSLRLMLLYLTQYDAVTFYNLVNSIQTNEKAFGQNSGWLFMDAADRLFKFAKERVLGSAKKKDSKGKDQEVNTEECPKWKLLHEILKEVKEESVEDDVTVGASNVLVVADDERTCNQLREYLRDGGKSILQRLYNKTLGNKDPQEVESPPKPKKKRTSEGQADVTLTQIMRKHVDKQGIEEEDDEFEDVESTETSLLQNVVIRPLRGYTDHSSLYKTLHYVKPKYVILYDADMAFVRQLEVFKASRSGLPLRVYFLLYTGSVEEQRYLTTLRKEKEAFVLLIKEKATMVIPEEREGKLEDDVNLERSSMSANETVNTRKGAGQPTKPTQQKIIVDMREFRSELPSLIHKRGIDIEPLTIEVGDYILSPDICVERKSVSDLIGSLNNGRLYNQCVSMCRYYKKPVLLIEFDPKKSFSLQGKYQLSNEVSVQDVTSKLALLTIHFPHLRIIWCQSPYATAELFEDLKAGRLEPDAMSCLAITKESEESGDNLDKYTFGPKEMLLKMPGISSKNCFAIMNSVTNISELCSLSRDKLTELLGSDKNSDALWDFLHSDQKQADPPDTAPQTKMAGKGKRPARPFGRTAKRKT